MSDIRESCACGCDEEVPPRRVYRFGRDARHRDRLVDLLVGRLGGTRERARRINALIEGLTERG